MIVLLDDVPAHVTTPDDETLAHVTAPDDVTLPAVTAPDDVTLVHAMAAMVAVPESVGEADRTTDPVPVVPDQVGAAEMVPVPVWVRTTIVEAVEPANLEAAFVPLP